MFAIILPFICHITGNITTAVSSPASENSSDCATNPGGRIITPVIMRYRGAWIQCRPCLPARKRTGLSALLHLNQAAGMHIITGTGIVPESLVFSIGYGYIPLARSSAEKHITAGNTFSEERSRRDPRRRFSPGCRKAREDTAGIIVDIFRIRRFRMCSSYTIQ